MRRAFIFPIASILTLTLSAPLGQQSERIEEPPVDRLPQTDYGRALAKLLREKEQRPGVKGVFIPGMSVQEKGAVFSRRTAILVAN
jgi:hypothetical protein